MGNLKAQAAYVTNLLQSQKEDKAWKTDAEANIRQVQQAGNQLEEKVRLMGEAAVLIRLDQEDKIKTQSQTIKELENDVQQLQRDILDQDAVNKEQQSRISHLEKVVEDLIDRMTKQEDRINQETTSSQRTTRATAP